MKALNGIAVRDTPVGLVAVLPPRMSDDLMAWWRTADFTAPLGVVTKCERCENGMLVSDADFGVYPCGLCDTGYGPLKFVKVLDVWPIRLDYTDFGTSAVVVMGPWMMAAGQVRFVPADGGRTTPLDLPDAVPGGVALHVEWTDCPNPKCHQGYVDRPWGERTPCPTCQTPFVPPSDAPIVEVDQ